MIDLIVKEDKKSASASADAPGGCHGANSYPTMPAPPPRNMTATAWSKTVEPCRRSGLESMNGDLTSNAIMAGTRDGTGSGAASWLSDRDRGYRPALNAGFTCG